ncbi:hypothetical protein OSB04_023750 [Centaurea solstitialis]|uniref:Reverse transcriptase Ty1/copia-type domain-containing protein n=1 Tax=Centaurea solstitialis TaxID=347529 RepID=A0AA38T4E5_9ASTR|nr:hypothetical protein OSB04_023750 [Centaurea solstitialis]
MTDRDEADISIDDSDDSVHISDDEAPEPEPITPVPVPEPTISKRFRFQKRALSKTNSEHAKMNDNPHHLGSRGYLGKQDSWAKYKDQGVLSDIHNMYSERTREFLLARTLKSGPNELILPDKMKPIAEELIEKDKQFSHGDWDPDVAVDPLEAVLGPEHPGRTRGVGHNVKWLSERFSRYDGNSADSPGVNKSSADSVSYDPLIESMQDATNCDLLFRCGASKLLVAKGLAFPLSVNIIHGRYLEEGFMKVQIDMVMDGCEEYDLPVPMPDSDVQKLGQAIGNFIQWEIRSVELRQATINKSVTSATPVSEPIPLRIQNEDVTHSKKVVTTTKVPSMNVPIHPQVFAQALSVWVMAEIEEGVFGPTVVRADVKYDDLRELFSTHCNAFDVLNHVDDTYDALKPKPTDPEWHKIDSVVKMWIYGTLSQNLLPQVLKKDASARHVWQNLETLFRVNKDSKALQIDSELRNINMGDVSVTAYCTKIKILADLLANLDPESAIPDKHLVIYTINALLNLTNLVLLLRITRLVSLSSDVIATVLFTRSPHPLHKFSSLQVPPSGINASVIPALNEEYRALISNGTWVLVPRSPKVNVIRSMWLFRYKFHADVTLARYKARLVANGKSQQQGIDCDETFSPVVKPATIRTETVYMHQPPGFRDSQHSDYVCHLQRSLYGLKQAPRAWYQRFAQYAIRLRFQQSRTDPSLFIYHTASDTSYLLLYVDDIILTASTTDLLRQIIKRLSISAIRSFTGLFLSQQQYATELLERANMTTCNPCRTLAEPVHKLDASGPPVSDPTLYRSLAGALQYLTFT